MESYVGVDTFYVRENQVSTSEAILNLTCSKSFTFPALQKSSPATG
jgi:hypothetical protein